MRQLTVLLVGLCVCGVCVGIVPPHCENTNSKLVTHSAVNTKKYILPYLKGNQLFKNDRNGLMRRVYKLSILRYASAATTRLKAFMGRYAQHIYRIFGVMSVPSPNHIDKVEEDNIEYRYGGQSLSSHLRDLVSSTLRDITRDAEFILQAHTAGLDINEDLIARYFAGCEWRNTYHGLTIKEAVKEAVRLREVYNVATGANGTALELVMRGVFQINGTDKIGRPVILIRPGLLVDRQVSEDYISAMLHVLERAESICKENKVENFVSVIDMTSFQWHHMPPMRTVADAMTVLKFLYPDRMGVLYVVNPGKFFNFVWRVVKPLISKKSQSNVHILTLEEYQTISTAESISDEIY